MNTSTADRANQELATGQYTAVASLRHAVCTISGRDALDSSLTGRWTMAQGKKTGSKAATKASGTLSSDSTGKASKSAAGSALSQSGNAKKTSAEAATAASKTLRDGRTSAASKSAAGSALSQKQPSRGGKKK